MQSTPPKITVLVTAFLLLGSHAGAGTPFDQMLGVRTAQLITNNILAAPPLPSLAGSRESAKSHLTPQLTYLKVKAQNLDGDTTGGSFRGSLNGYAAGLGFTHDTQTKLSFYGFATFSQTRGQIDALSETSSESGIALKAMNNTSTNLLLGGSYRPWTENEFPVAIGILGGPFISRYTSNLNYQNTPQNIDDHYSATSLVYGPMIGIQFYAKIWRLALNPYFLYYKDLSSPCRSFKTDSTTDKVNGYSSQSCNGDNREIYLDGTFFAYGLSLGLGGFSLGVFSQAEKDSSLSSISVQSYNLAYTLSF